LLRTGIKKLKDIKQVIYLHSWLVKELQSAVSVHCIYFSFDSDVMSLIVLDDPTISYASCSNVLEFVTSIKFTVDASTVHIAK
jgi:hypothetical protein